MKNDLETTNFAEPHRRRDTRISQDHLLGACHFPRGLNRYPAQRSISRAIQHRYSTSARPQKHNTDCTKCTNNVQGTVSISVGMPGVARKMIRALRYRATTIDHDIPITSYVSLIRRVQRSTKALQPWEPVTVPVVFREPGLVPRLRSFFSFLSLFFAHFLFSFIFFQFFFLPSLLVTKSYDHEAASTC